MTDLYCTVEMSNNLENSKEVIKYYLTKEESYGFKITITSNDDENEMNKIIRNNITADKEKIKDLVRILAKSGSEFSLIDDIIEDYANQSVMFTD